MSHLHSQPEPLLTIIDRLCSSETQTANVAWSRKPEDGYLELVKKDLEWLFNSRRSPNASPDSYPELASSVYAYGFPDISAYDPTLKKDQEKLREIMQTNLETFDRRFRDVQIEVEATPGSSNGLNFKIRAVLLSEAAPEEICFETILNGNGKYEVK